MALFEAENLLVDYREQLLRKLYDELTRPLPVWDNLGDPSVESVYNAQIAERNNLLDIGWERWRNGEVNSDTPRFATERYELWNSVPPNPERLVWHFDT